MKNAFSKLWKSSTQIRKQRKFRFNAPLHIRRKFMSVNLSKELRAIHKTRNVTVRTGDTVKVLRGQFKGKSGKVNKVNIQYGKIYIDGITITKKDGSTFAYPIRPSNCQILSLNLTDQKRKVKLGE